MGLDIKAVRKAAFVHYDKECEDYDNHHPVWVGALDRFKARRDGIDPGCYSVTESMHFHAGSYSDYNRWREELSRQALGVDPEEVWNNWDEYEGKPFAELIHFTDCEGVIGPVTAAKLAADFAAFEPEETREPWYSFLDNYNHFAAAFQMAADGGFVVFQ